MPVPSEVDAQSIPKLERSLPSGRSVLLRTASGAEEIEVRSPAGDVEVRIVLTDAGPVVTLRGAKLEMEATDELALKCKRLSLDATDAASLRSQGGLKVEGQELRVRTTDDIHLNGAHVRLNCPETPPAGGHTAESSAG